MLQTSEPNLFAFDFDGVLCNGLREYFQVAWRTYAELALESEGVDPLAPPAELFAGFAQGRARIETGWEMPLLVYALRQGRSPGEIVDRWSELLTEFQALPQMPPAAELAHRLDRLRDQWIQTDLEGWLGLHEFYPGVIEALQGILAQGHEVAIVSTKEGRFIQQLLADAAVSLPVERILGKEVKRSKRDTLKLLMAEFKHCQSVHFIEDRLAALQSITADPTLERVNLYLAGWGYNTAQDRDMARQDDRIHLLETIDFTPFIPTKNP
jgi:phosphoglycolate phosphatase-like HAD superfamily hydrolase